MSEQAVVKTLQDRYDRGTRLLEAWDKDIAGLQASLAELKAARKTERRIVKELETELLEKGVEL